MFFGPALYLNDYASRNRAMENDKSYIYPSKFQRAYHLSPKCNRSVFCMSIFYSNNFLSLILA